MALGHKTGGRQAGTPNKRTGPAKIAFAAAFDGLGGVEQLTTWAKENMTEFYRLYSKLIPQEYEIGEETRDAMAQGLAAVYGAVPATPEAPADRDDAS